MTHQIRFALVFAACMLSQATWAAKDCQFFLDTHGREFWFANTGFTEGRFSLSPGEVDPDIENNISPGTLVTIVGDPLDLAYVKERNVYSRRSRGAYTVTNWFGLNTRIFPRHEITPVFRKMNGIEKGMMVTNRNGNFLGSVLWMTGDGYVVVKDSPMGKKNIFRFGDIFPVRE